MKNGSHSKILCEKDCDQIATMQFKLCGQARIDCEGGYKLFVLGLQGYIIYYKLFPSGKTLDLDLYCQELNWLKQAIDQKRPELTNRRDVVFYLVKDHVATWHVNRDGRFYCINLIARTWCQATHIFFCPCQTVLEVCENLFSEYFCQYE